MTKNSPALLVGEEEGRDGERKSRNEMGFAKSGLCTKGYSFIKSEVKKKNLHIHDALKSHRRKREMISAPWLSSCL